MRDVRESIPHLVGAPPSGPKREWGKPQARAESPQASSKSQQGFGKGAQGYSKPVPFVKSDDPSAGRDPLSDRQSTAKTDEELESERKEQRRQEEENSFKDVSCLFI